MPTPGRLGPLRLAPIHHEGDQLLRGSPIGPRPTLPEPLHTRQADRLPGNLQGARRAGASGHGGGDRLKRDRPTSNRPPQEDTRQDDTVRPDIGPRRGNAMAAAIDPPGDLNTAASPARRSRRNAPTGGWVTAHSYKANGTPDAVTVWQRTRNWRARRRRRGAASTRRAATPPVRPSCWSKRSTNASHHREARLALLQALHPKHNISPCSSSEG